MASTSPTADPLQLFGRRFLGGRFTGSQLAWAVLAAVLLVTGIAEILGGRWHSPWPVSLFDLALMTLPIAVVWARPAGAALLVSAAIVFECGVFTSPQSMAALFAGMSVAAGVARYARGRGLWVLGLLAVLNGWVAFRDPTDTDKWDYLFTLMIWASAAIGGLLLRGRHSAILRAVDEAVRARTEQGLAVQQAIADERSRIARDLHDVVAHAVSLMVIQAAAGRAVGARDPERAARVFDTIEASGQSALGDLRRLLGVLQTGDSAEAQPPGLTAVEDLVAATDAAGLPCRVRWDGDLDDVPDGIDVAAFRVVQESITNALKHGARAGLDITIARSAAGIRVDVLDRAGGTTETSSLVGSGHGLQGMRERVAMYDGTLAAGPTQGGWRVEAFFPVVAGA